MSIFIACPSYDGFIHFGTSQALATALDGEQRDVIVRCRQSSLLADCFNGLWTMALNMRRVGVTHFAMIHADISPRQGWLTHLMEEMGDKYKVMSALVPIKDSRRVSSCAWTDPERMLMMKNISMDEAWNKLPVTFDSSHGEEGKILLINTGLWVADIREEWAEKAYFEIRTGTKKLKDGMMGHWVISEDWGFSMQLHDMGVPYGATTRVSLLHHGGTMFSNSPEDEMLQPVEPAVAETAETT